MCLSRIYTGDFTRLAPGRCRYAVLLGEDGLIRDDGIVARLAAGRFHVTTTTAGAAFVLHHMEDYLQTEFSDLHVWLTSTTEQWAVIALQGPRSEAVLAAFVSDADVTAMPHMSVRECRIGEIPVRLFRTGFTGEAGFEINLPPEQAQRVWSTLLQCNVMPYGTDAMHVLRAEMGYIIIGQETDGTVAPGDVGLGWMIGGGDFVGKRSLSLPDLKRAGRRQLVGLLPVDPAVVLDEGAQVTEAASVRAVGHVTSSYRSATLGRSFALALVDGGRSRIGSLLNVPMPDRVIEVAVTDPVFLDKTGERRRARPMPPPVIEPLLAARDEPALPARACASVQLSVLGPATRLSVRASAAAAPAVGAALGVPLPATPCRSVTTGGRAALWLGPDEWLVFVAGETPDLAVLAPEHPHCSIVDVSSRSRTIEVAGTNAACCLNAFCALDLGVSAFPVGMCTRTLLGQAGVVLWRIAPEAFRLDVARSLVPYVWACLEEALLEFIAPDVSPDC